jgi:hypothetical protein
VIAPGTYPSEGALVSTPGTPPGRKDMTVMLGACPGASGEPSTFDPGQTEEMVAAVGLPGFETDWQRPITEYL